MSKKIVYRLNVWATQPLADDADVDNPDFPTLEGATTPGAKRLVEESASTCLRRMEQDCDVELMDFTVEEDE